MTTLPKWDPAEFHHWYSRMPSERKPKVLDDLRPDQRRLYNEWRTFGAFARVARLDVDPRTIENREPPEPDIRCLTSGVLHYFELGEVVDQTLARTAGMASKEGQDIFGGSLSQLAPLRRIFEQKCSKTYVTNGRSLDLLLHYSVGHQYPHTARVQTDIGARHQGIVNDLRKSPFNRLWLYDGWDQRVIACVER